MNAKRGFYNVFFGLIGQFVSIALGFIIPRLVIVSWGSESNGLLSSVSQALTCLNLLEAGVGMATLQALYKPVAEHDTQSINHVLSATDRYYKKVGACYFIGVLSLSLLFPVIVHSDLSYFTIFAVVLFSGMSNVIGFLFQGKYRLLMQVEGKSYILTNLGTVIGVFTSVGKIILLICGLDIVALQLMYFLFNLVQLIYISVYVKKNYKWIDLSVRPDYDAISQKNSVMVHQISALIFQNTDVLILTVVCGLKTVSVYSMYSMLFGMIATAISTINSGFSFAMGQAYNTDKKKFNVLFNAFETYNMSLTFSLYCVTNIFIIPFLKIYTSGITDINYVDTLLPYLFVATYLLSNGRSAAQRVIEYAGHFNTTKNHAVIESAINIIVSVACVMRFGIYGVLCGTIAALLYKTNYMILYSSKKLLKRSPAMMYLKWAMNFILYALVIVIFSTVFRKIEFSNYFVLILYAAVSCLIIVPVFFAVGSIIDKQSFRFCIDFLKSHIRTSRRKDV